MKLYFLFFGFTMYSVYFSHTTHRNLLCILYISQMSPTGHCYAFRVILPCHPQGFALHSVHFTHATSKQSRSPESSQPHPSQQRRALHQLRGQGSGVWYGMVWYAYGMLMVCLRHHYSNIFSISCILYFSHATRRDLLRILYTSPTPRTRIHCVFCIFLPCHPQGFALHSVSFSHATHKDLLCILCTSPMPPTGICSVVLHASASPPTRICCTSPMPPTGIYCTFFFTSPICG